MALPFKTGLLLLCGVGLCTVHAGCSGCSDGYTPPSGEYVSDSPQDIPNNVTSLTGQVLDFYSGKPIEGALVSTEPVTESVYTTNKGEYALVRQVGVDVSYTISAAKRGYVPGILRVEFAGTGKASGLNIVLRRLEEDDEDADGVVDSQDNCPSVANPEQIDSDMDGTGDSCDNCVAVFNNQVDSDHDGLGDACDNCPETSNEDQANNDDDADADGDVCDEDDDNDGIFDDGDGSGDPTDNLCTDGETENCDDNCPLVANETQQNSDGANDGGNACDEDDDDDGILDDGDGSGELTDNLCANEQTIDCDDNCPQIANPAQHNTDDDSAGDLCDDDDDNDMVVDGEDNCPLVPNPIQRNTDGANDGGDACDNDDDNDMVVDDEDNCLLVVNENQLDTDMDGVGDMCDNCLSTANTEQTNSDEDSLGDACDNCLLVANEEQSNIDLDRDGDVCDEDADNDGIFDDGDGSGDIGDNLCSDGETENCDDNCPLVANQNQHNTDGANDDGDACDNDDDNDMVVDDEDNCPLVVNENQLDTDMDGVGDMCDNCPFVANTEQTNSDEDPLGDACDNCPQDINPTQLDYNDDGLGNACSECEFVPRVDSEILDPEHIWCTETDVPAIDIFLARNNKVYAIDIGFVFAIDAAQGELVGGTALSIDNPSSNVFQKFALSASASENEIYAVHLGHQEPGSSRIVKYTPSDSVPFELRYVDEVNDDDGWLELPTSIHMAPNGDLYVGEEQPSEQSPERGQINVFRYDAEMSRWSVIASWTPPSLDGEGGFLPFGIAGGRSEECDGDQCYLLYIADIARGEVRVVEVDLETGMLVGPALTNTLTDEIHCPLDVESLAVPNHVALDRFGNAFVIVEQANHGEFIGSVCVFNNRGVFRRRFDPTQGLDGWGNAWGIHVGHDGDLYVASGPYVCRYNIRYRNDIDGDSVCNSGDNCPDISNPDQRDENNNGVGDQCE